MLKPVLDAFLRVRLPWKIAGANALVIIVAGVVLAQESAPRLLALLLVLFSVAMNVWLVLIALRPLHGLVDTANRVADGDWEARVPHSRIADPDMARLSQTFNHLIDELMARRNRIQRLAAEVIREVDQERDAVGRTLHDSSAQSLAAIAWRAGAAAQDPACPPAVRAHLDAIQDAATGVLDEVRSLADDASPRVLNDLGLAAALTALARRTRQRSHLRVNTRIYPGTDEVSPAVARVLYRVAEEGVGNAVRHSHAHGIEIAAGLAADGAAWVRVTDDGLGFDVRAAEQQGAGTGLFTIRERLALASGTFEVVSAPVTGTTVTGRVPLKTMIPKGDFLPPFATGFQDEMSI